MAKKQIKFKIISIDEKNESFEVEWDDGFGNKKTLNYNLPEQMYMSNVDVEKLKQFVASRVPYEIKFSQETLEFPGESLKQMKEVEYTVSYNQEQGSTEIKENEEDI